MAKVKESKQKKMNARVDFTPMVDMIMLLVTFFMLCTTLMKPQSMDLVMPSDKEDIKDEDKSQVQTDEAITIIADENNKLYYFEGKPTDAHLTETAYGKDGIRLILQKKNRQAIEQVLLLKKEYDGKRTGDAQKEKVFKEEYEQKLSQIKKQYSHVTAIIKLTDEATYANMIDILDEMKICYVGTFVIDKINGRDEAMLSEVKGN